MTSKTYYQVCTDCGQRHRYYTKPFDSCRRLVEVAENGFIIKCGGPLTDSQAVTKVKKARKCGKCGKTGHNARTCGK